MAWQGSFSRRISAARVLVGRESVLNEPDHQLWRERPAGDRYDAREWHLAEVVVGSADDGRLVDVWAGCQQTDSHPRVHAQPSPVRAR